MHIEAAPIVVDPSGDFIGDDGPWSSFLINVGNPPQKLQVLVSTEVSSTWVVAPGGCGPAYPVNCTGARGGAYDSTKSSTWNVNALYLLGAETNLGNPYSAIDQIGDFGYDTIGIPGQSGVAIVSMDHQVIAAIETNTYYLGSLGLSSENITFTSGDTSPSFLGSLRNENLIPSLSFGYTAGASYRQNGTNGSLTLGGYDASRFIPNDVSFTFAPVVMSQLVVGLQSITYSNSTTQTPLLSQGINALVDSTVPYLWLPESTCEAFKQAFGLTLDPIHNLYTVNDSSHEANIKHNASIVFQLSNSLTGGDPSINITLPYASFDLVAMAPLVSSQTRYFPLQRGNDDTQYTLGRTFLQESFLIVDYEQSNFSISQATFDASVPSHIVAISHANTTGTTTTANPTSSNTAIVKSTNNSSHDISTGAIAGIAIAIALIAILCGSFFIFRSLRRKRQSRKLAITPIDKPKVMSDIESDHKHDFSDAPEIKKNTTTTITVAEVPMTPPLSEADGNEFFTAFEEKRQPQSRITELPAEPVDRSEMPSPSPEELRSELSTPEPKWNYPELPSPDPSQELPSAGLRTTDSDHPSPDLEQRRSPSLDNRRSALTSPEPRLRPDLMRVGSSESEAGWTRGDMPTGPFHCRYQFDESDTPSVSTRPRHSRMDSSDSEALIHSNRINESLAESLAESESPSSFTGPTFPQVDSSEPESPISSPSLSSSASRQRNIRTDSSSESEYSISPASLRRGGVSSTFHSSSSTRPATTLHSSSSARPGMRRLSAVPRPATQRMNTGDSDTWETRLQSASDSNSTTAGSRFGSIIIRHQRGESAGNIETREVLLNEDNVTRHDRQFQ